VAVVSLVAVAVSVAVVAAAVVSVVLLAVVVSVALVAAAVVSVATVVPVAAVAVSVDAPMDSIAVFTWLKTDVNEDVISLTIDSTDAVTVDTLFATLSYAPFAAKHTMIADIGNIAILSAVSVPLKYIAALITTSATMNATSCELTFLIAEKFLRNCTM